MGYYYDSWNDADVADRMSVSEHYKEVNKLEDDIEALNNQIVEVKRFLASLLHPEELGWAVSNEVRRKAKDLFDDLGGYND